MVQSIPVRLTLLALALAASLGAQQITTPAVIAAGFNAYKVEGPQAAIKTWLKGSPLEESKEALSQANMLNQIHDFYGPFKSYDIIQIHSITPSAAMVYLAINCEKGLIFGKFLLFRRGDSWSVLSFRFHTDADQVLPGSLVAH